MRTTTVLPVTGILLIAVQLQGCATVTTGTTQTITVETRPPGATCALAREGQSVAVVNPTPGSVTLGKDKDELDVKCELKGYQPATAVLKSTFQGWTLGNALLGGLIGIAIDAGSGAMNEYPTAVSLTLIPDAFADAGERDRYFDQAVADVNAKADALAKTDKYSCKDDLCQRNLKKLNEERDAGVADLEAKRHTARVATTEAPSTGAP